MLGGVEVPHHHDEKVFVRGSGGSKLDGYAAHLFFGERDVRRGEAAHGRARHLLVAGRIIISRPARERPLEEWFESLNIRPRVVAELDDAALAKIVGEAGLGVFAAPDVVEKAPGG